MYYGYKNLFISINYLRKIDAKIRYLISFVIIIILYFRFHLFISNANFQLLSY